MLNRFYLYFPLCFFLLSAACGGSSGTKSDAGNDVYDPCAFGGCTDASFDAPISTGSCSGMTNDLDCNSSGLGCLWCESTGSCQSESSFECVDCGLRSDPVVCGGDGVCRWCSPIASCSSRSQSDGCSCAANENDCIALGSACSWCSSVNVCLGGVAGCDGFGLAFVSSATYTPAELGSVSAADTKCKELAANGTDRVKAAASEFVAWMSDSQSNARDRIGSHHIPIWTPDLGGIVAMGSSDFSDGSLLRPINRNESGNKLSAGQFAWTGSDEFGRAIPGELCSDWQAGGFVQVGRVGEVDERSEKWSYGSDAKICDDAWHIYCVTKKTEGN
ncbi:MAG: hypothetical protein IPJ88_08630 [Myxococcales bacterium]|nr:MAG: hypothetical protein IPJ88_08630 [Myxococcales bacterium]